MPRPPSDPPVRRPHAWLTRWPAAAALWLVVLALWAAAAAGRPPRLWIGRAAVLVAVTALVLFAGAWLRRRWRQGGEGRLLLLLLAVSVLVHFAGLDHEIAQSYFRDEGTYLEKAKEINGGQLLSPWFIYPHLLFYLDAVALWIAAIFEPLVSWLARAAYGIESPARIPLLVVRHVTAALGALTVLPVFAISRRLGGTAAAAIGGALAVLSPLYVHFAHLNISDVAAAFFATLTVAAAAALLDRDELRLWLAAGVAAGLAAGSKYPAGVVAIAIVALAVRWVFHQRRFPSGLVVAGLAALAAFLAATPSLVAFPDMVFRGGGADILFGYRQYSGRGWTGVVQSSNAAYYLGLLRQGLGAPAALLGLLGLALAPPATRRRVLWLLPFPLLYLVLILRMNVAVMRNLLPVLPILAALAGAGVAALLLRVAARRPRWRRATIAAGAALCLALPAYRTLEESVRLARASTREEAAAWVHANLPRGAVFLGEFYTPHLGNRWHYPFWRERFATRFSREALRDPAHDFLFLASAAYQRFLEPGKLVRASWDPALAERYREIFDTFPLVREFTPGLWQSGPTIRLYKIDPQPLVFGDRAAFGAADARVSNKIMLSAGEGVIEHRHLDNQWSLFKAYLAAGRYRITVDADMAGPAGRLRVANRDNTAIAEPELPAAQSLELELPADDKYFLYLHLPRGSRLRGMKVDGVDGDPPGH